MIMISQTFKRCQKIRRCNGSEYYTFGETGISFISKKLDG